MKPITFDELELIVNENETVVLFLSTNNDNERAQNLVFYEPLEILTTCDSSEVNNILNQVDEKVKQGFWVAGYISYEAGYAFEDKLNKIETYSFPLIWFVVFSDPLILNCSQADILNSLLEISKDSPSAIDNLNSAVREVDYSRAVTNIKNYISQGDIYQANYTYKKRFSYEGNPFAMFSRLHLNQPVGYSAYIQDKTNALLSLSPELFFRKNGREIVVKPMKGTIARGKTLNDDLRMRNELASCLKNRAENIMIVDLMRNDLGKISETGSVKTTSLFDVQPYSTLFQMTSTVNAKLRKNVSYRDLIRNIFPSGSVTGAPKIRAMEIIKEQEIEPRGVYTGSLGFISPSGNACFNIAIRTLFLDEQTKTGEIGIGSGIVADSDPQKEFDECALKADFLFREYNEFKLIETMLWEQGNFFLLDLHLKRLEKSARYFGFGFDKLYVINQLEKIAENFDIFKKYKLRMLLAENGKLSIEMQEFNDQRLDNINYVMLCDNKITSDSVFLYHKTTNRNFYNKHLQTYRQKGCFDVIFMNERDEITEGAISNIFIKKADIFYTPPVQCGLLNGTYREFFIRENPGLVKEKLCYKDDLLSADEIFLSNSVRGLVKVELKKICDRV